MKNIEPEINSTLDIAGKKFSEFKDITLENTQIKTQKKDWKKWTQLQRAKEQLLADFKYVIKVHGGKGGRKILKK